MNQSLPLVSVVIRTYNRSATLPRAVSSVLSQDYPKIELIVIDDGSTDTTVAVLRPFTGSLIYHFQENQGLAAGREKGLQLAKGTYIIYLDSDDWWEPGILSRMMPPLIGSAAGFAFSEWSYDDSRAQSRLHSTPLFCEINPTGDENQGFILSPRDARYLFIRNHHAPPSGTILRRDLLSRDFNVTATVADDWVAILDIILHHHTPSVYFSVPLWNKGVDGSNIYDGSLDIRGAIELELKDNIWIFKALKGLFTPDERFIIRQRVSQLFIDRAFHQRKISASLSRSIVDCVRSFFWSPNAKALREGFKQLLRA